MKISEYIMNIDKYKVDKTYQRPADVWSAKDKQCLIDTIMRGEPMPLFFFNYNTKEDVYYIVDGQQRLKCISDFYNNKFALDKEFSEPSLVGKRFKDLTSKERDKFQSYNLSPKIMKDYDDERVRMIFSRLQRGKPLGIGEKLNAKPGKIVYALRELANHDFIVKSTGVNKQRYHTYEDVARIMHFEKFGPKDCSTNALNELFDKFKDDIDTNSKLFKKVQSVFNYLLKCFPAEPGNYQYLSKHAWVFTVYSVISDLKDTYVLKEREDDIRRFVENFHNRIYSEDWRVSDIKLQRFYDNSRGGWAERLNTNRKNTMKEYMIQELNLIELDDSRQISDEEKIQSYARVNKKCERCGKSFKDYKEAEYHHIDYYCYGGPSEVDNIMVLCQQCHDDIHKTDCNNETVEEFDDEIE